MSYDEILKRMALEKPLPEKFNGVQSALKDLEKRAPDHYSRIIFTRSILRQILSTMKDVKILDIGVGSMPMAYGLPNINLYVALDLYKPYLKQYMGKDITLINGSFDNIPLADQSFDVSLWFEGPEHSIDPNHTFKEIKRVTKKMVLTSTPNGEYENWRINWEHLHVFTYNSLKQLLSDHFSAFEIMKVKPYWLIAICWIN